MRSPFISPKSVNAGSQLISIRISEMKQSPDQRVSLSQQSMTIAETRKKLSDKADKECWITLSLRSLHRRPHYKA